MDSLYNFDIDIVFTNGHCFMGFGRGVRVLAAWNKSEEQESSYWQA